MHLLNQTEMKRSRKKKKRSNTRKENATVRGGANGEDVKAIDEALLVPQKELLAYE